MTDVFLAYSHKDNAIAKIIANELKRHKLSVFFDMRIATGKDYSEEIEAALNSSNVVIVLLTKMSIRSSWVLAEANYALKMNKLVPVLIDVMEPTLPSPYNRTVNIDLTQWSSNDAKSADVQHLISKILQFLAKDKKLHTISEAKTKYYSPYKTDKKASDVEVFLAHASPDKKNIQNIVTTLIDQGFNLWIDKPQNIGLPKKYEDKIIHNRILSGNDWRESIRKAIKKADIVLALWSTNVVKEKREQFQYEIYLGLKQQKLHQCQIDDVDINDIGMPYNFEQIANLSDLSERKYHSELNYLMDDLRKQVS